jgi:hypothetical protein
VRLRRSGLHRGVERRFGCWRDGGVGFGRLQPFLELWCIRIIVRFIFLYGTYHSEPRCHLVRLPVAPSGDIGVGPGRLQPFLELRTVSNSRFCPPKCDLPSCATFSFASPASLAFSPCTASLTASHKTRQPFRGCAGRSPAGRSVSSCFSRIRMTICNMAPTSRTSVKGIHTSTSSALNAVLTYAWTLSAIPSTASPRARYCALSHFTARMTHVGRWKRRRTRARIKGMSAPPGSCRLVSFVSRRLLLW